MSTADRFITSGSWVACESSPENTPQVLESLNYFERKEYEELKESADNGMQRRNDRAVFLSYFSVSLIAILLISGALKINLSVFGI